MTMTPSDILVANIAYQKDGPVQVHLERLLTSTETTGYAEVSSNDIISHSKKPVHAVAGIRKAYNKGLKATLRVQQFLNSISENMDPQITLSATMNIGARSIVGGPPTGCHARDGPASFEEVDFEFLNVKTQPTNATTSSFWTPEVPRSMTSTQYLHFTCPTLKLDDAIVDMSGHPRYDSISITSRICLFSNNIRKVCDLAGGNLNLTPLNYSKPTIYEIEFIARATPAIADLACTVLARYEASSISAPLSINLDIPTWHYYKAMDASLEQGLCSAADALLYIEALERRHDQISAVFEAAIRHACSDRGQAPIINTSSRTNLVSACIKSALKAGFRPGFEDVMQELYEEKDGVWRQFLELIPAKDRPEDFQSLGLLFYVYQAMRTAFIPRVLDQAMDYDFGSSLQISSPEEMSICLPDMPSSTRFSSTVDNFYLNKSMVVPDWSHDHACRLIGETTDGDNNELSFDAPSTVDIKVLSSDTWVSSAGTDSDFDEVGEIECLTAVEDASYKTADYDNETVSFRSVRLNGQDVVHSKSNIFHLPPRFDSFDSAACMTGAPKAAGSKLLAQACDGNLNDDMLPTLIAVDSFCIQASALNSEPSSDDELASHGFMLPSPVLSRSFSVPYWDRFSTEEALPILTDDDTSHNAMLSTHTESVVHRLNMDKSEVENDEKTLDNMASSAVMESYKRARTIKKCALEDVRRTEPASYGERLSCAVMLPTSSVASSLMMVDGGWTMNASVDHSAAHAAMMQYLGTVGADDLQPAGIDELESCVAMLPTSEAASTAIMLLVALAETSESEDDEATSHTTMLATFTEPEFLEMAKHMCMASSMTTIDGRDILHHREAIMDEFAAHAAMKGTILPRKEEDSHHSKDTKQTFDDAVVSHFAMVFVDNSASSSGMIGSPGLRDGSSAEFSATMPLDDHASHSAMARITDHGSSTCMLSTLAPDDRELTAEMVAADFDVELASHAAMRGIVDLSSSFCMAETLTTVLKIKEDTTGHVLMAVADNNVVILFNEKDEDASNITMLYPAAEEVVSHAAMVSVAANSLTDMDINEQASHVAMLSDSTAPFFIGKPAKLTTIFEDTSEGLASHTAMLPTSNDELVSHEAMLPTSTDESASHEIMRPTSNDEVVSHAAMILDTNITERKHINLKTEGLDSHTAMLTSSICMAATLSEKSVPTTRARSTRSSTSSGAFVKLPKNKTAFAPLQQEKPRVLILSVDDRCEKQIYSRAQSLLKKLRASPNADTTPTLVEAYLMNRVFANGNAEGDILYFEDPRPGLPVGKDGSEIEPVELVRKLYGEETASNLDNWFKNVGLNL